MQLVSFNLSHNKKIHNLSSHFGTNLYIYLYTEMILHLSSWHKCSYHSNKQCLKKSHLPKTKLKYLSANVYLIVSVHSSRTHFNVLQNKAIWLWNNISVFCVNDGNKSLSLLFHQMKTVCWQCAQYKWWCQWWDVSITIPFSRKCVFFSSWTCHKHGDTWIWAC